MYRILIPVDDDSDRATAQAEFVTDLPLESEAVDVSVGEMGQPPAEGVVDPAEELDADLLVPGGRKQSPAGEVLFGSVTQQVLLRRTDRSSSPGVSVRDGDRLTAPHRAGTRRRRPGVRRRSRRSSRRP